ncbi:MAG TPA: hypothetical protein DCY13_13285 [Verrucomicrobiales bacterium]|nr:hypothetical protein [Verrucomicrobiales bacterium]
MSFAEVIRELPSLSVAERQALVRRALELDEPGLSPADEELVEARLRDHRAHPESALSRAEIENRLRSRFTK